jgi:transformation/transcription domain-associated protein
MQESLKPNALELLDVLMEVVANDDEDNASAALKTIVELHKAYKTHMEERVAPFFQMVQEMFKNMPEAVRETFDDPVGVSWLIIVAR